MRRKSTTLFFFFYTVPTKAELMHVFPTFPTFDDLVHEVVFTSFYNCSVLGNRGTLKHGDTRLSCTFH